ncbi:MAG: LeuA family protein [Nitrosospira sp.]|nr:LeuA family protein [Nitrosospira sp.]
MPIYRYNRMSETRPQLNPCIIDTTLREGAQAPGVRFGEEESTKIAHALVSLGIDMVECGHPLISDAEARRVRATVAACGAVPVLAHARARFEDIDSVKATGAQWVGIFVGVNSISRNCRIRFEQPVYEVVSKAVGHAKNIGLRVRFTVEDGSRTPWSELVEGYRAALEAGADRLCFADTVGLLCPWEVEELIGRLSREFAGCDLEAHFHNDRGMAIANALSAVRAGARWISSSVNGIGERCGIVDTLTLLANLDALKWRRLRNGHALPHVSKLVQAYSRLMLDRLRPIAGMNAFTHVAKLHQRAVLGDERAYAWTVPETIGRVNSTDPEVLPSARERLINHPEVMSTAELPPRQREPGDRYVMLDDRVVPDARQYCTVRRIPEMDDHGEGHVDAHRHCVDSVFLFIGHGPDLSGLTVEVRLGAETFVVESPSSVFIPSGLLHSYRVLAGAGLFINHGQAGDYDSSLLDPAIFENDLGDAATESRITGDPGELFSLHIRDNKREPII